eukprot:158623-Prymnesium_polylepis.1
MAHEKRAGRNFDFVVRIRPDAVFLSKFPFDVRDACERARHTGSAILPLGGLGGNCYHACANDHMAIEYRPTSGCITVLSRHPCPTCQLHPWTRLLSRVVEKHQHPSQP